jgi:hypothetical protein
MEIPMPEAYLMKKRGEHVPEHMANCLYLEWFSEQNGRVVIESVDYELSISAPEWRLTAEEDAERARLAAAGMDWFMQKLSEAIEKQERGQKDPGAGWDEHDYEKFLRESDARTDKYLELLDKYGDSEAAEEKIAREMGWDDEGPTDDDEGMSISEINDACEAAASEPPPAPEPHREGIDWIRTRDGEIRHPLQHRCFESARKLWHEAGELGLKNSDDAGVMQFIFEFQTCAVKLAGALNGVAENRYTAPAFTVACLKRALNHLHLAQAGLEAVAPKKVLPEKMIADARKEMFQIREGILNLMREFRDGI